MSWNDYHKRRQGIEYLIRLRQNKNWGTPHDRKRLEEDVLDGAFTAAFIHCDFLYHTNEAAIWKQVCGYLDSQIGIHMKQISLYQNVPSYVEFTEELVKRDTQHLKWCKKIVMSLSNQPGCSVPTSRKRKLVASEPGQIYMILRSGKRIRTGGYWSNHKSLRSGRIAKS
jgi:hypothetical protein